MLEHSSDVQRLDIKDLDLYGISPSDPGPMVLCNQCDHVMAAEGIMRHIKRVHGSKIVPAPSSKVRSLLALKGNLTAGGTLSSSAGIHSSGSSSNSSRSSSSSAIGASLSSQFSNRLNVSKMAPPSHLSSSGNGNFIFAYNFVLAQNC